MNPLYEQMSVSVFARMSGLAAQHGAINLGQGFPDFGWPEEILDFAARALTLHGSDPNLVNDGFDPAKVSDPLLFLDGERGYVTLDAALHERILRGEVRV